MALKMECIPSMKLGFITFQQRKKLKSKYIYDKENIMENQLLFVIYNIGIKSKIVF